MAIIEITIGVIASIVATVFCFLFSQLWGINDKNTIDGHLEVVKTSLYEISMKVDYPEDYGRVVSLLDQVTIATYGAASSIRLLTYGLDFGKKKFVYTVLADLILMCESCRNTTVGYSGKSEIESRCEEIAEKISVYNAVTHPLSTKYCMIDMLKYYNYKNSFADSIKYSEIGRRFSSDEIIDFLKSDYAIERNSFKTDANVLWVRNRGFDRDSYVSFIESKMKHK
jgi:hypothetical protein